MDNTEIMSVFLRQIRQSIVSRHFIPMEMGMGWPILSIKKDKLCVTLPFYKVVLQPEDKTLLYPIAYTITVLWPIGTVIEFKDLRFDSRYSNIDFDRPVGTFRHEAIKELNKQQYEEKKEELYQLYDELIACLYSNEEFNEGSEKKLRELLGMLMEPSLRPFYMAIDIDFYNRLLND